MNAKEEAMSPWCWFCVVYELRRVFRVQGLGLRAVSRNGGICVGPTIPDDVGTTPQNPNPKP